MIALKGDLNFGSYVTSRIHLEYATCVCAPYETKYINQLEMVQRRAARFVCNNYTQQASVTNMMSELGWDSLEHRRQATRLTLMKQIQEGASAIPTSLTPPAVTRSRRSTISNNQQLQQTSCKTDAFKYSFFPRTSKDWNGLPDSIVNIKSLDTFKTQALKYVRQN